VLASVVSMATAACQSRDDRKTPAGANALPGTASASTATSTASVPLPGLHGNLPLPSMGEVARDLTDKGPVGHNFTDLYERFMGVWRHDPIRIFEIGVASGGSIRLWNAYYDKATVFAIDLVDSTQYENARTRTFIADQGNREQLAKAMAHFGGEFDFILDDGGHGMSLQQISLGFLFKYVKSGGYYVIEDLHTSLTNKYVGGGYGADPDGENTTLRMLERYIHGYPPKFESKYLLPFESAYLEEYVESLVISFRHDQEHSMVCIIRKR
jgi:demethylmacrocin O-methyltransferase